MLWRVCAVFLGGQDVDVVDDAVAHLLMKQRIFGHVQAAFQGIGIADGGQIHITQHTRPRSALYQFDVELFRIVGNVLYRAGYRVEIGFQFQQLRFFQQAQSA